MPLSWRAAAGADRRGGDRTPPGRPRKRVRVHALRGFTSHRYRSRRLACSAPQPESALSAGRVLALSRRASDPTLGMSPSGTPRLVDLILGTLVSRSTQSLLIHQAHVVIAWFMDRCAKPVIARMGTWAAHPHRMSPPNVPESSIMKEARPARQARVFAHGDIARSLGAAVGARRVGNRVRIEMVSARAVSASIASILRGRGPCLRGPCCG